MEPSSKWSHEETQALIAVWSEEKIQQDLRESPRNESVFRDVSRRLASMGKYHSAKQCREKIKKLKLAYRRVKENGEASGRNFRWYDALDAVLSQRAASDHGTMLLELMISDVRTVSPTTLDLPGSCPLTPSPAPVPTPFFIEHPLDEGSTSVKQEDALHPIPVPPTAEQATVKDHTLLCRWSKREVQAFLTLWASPAIQKELVLNRRNENIYAHLSEKLSSLGFTKTPKKCREKIKKLKNEYKRIMNASHSSRSNSIHKSVWFTILDGVLGSRSHTTQTTPPLTGSDTDDKTQWLPDEVQVLMTLWAQANIQKQLLTPATNSQVFSYLSNELTLVGFNKTADQCRLKVSSLTQEYKKIKEMEPYTDVKSEWFTILDGVLNPDGEASTEVDSLAVSTQFESLEEANINDSLEAVWSSDEVKILLTQWAEDSVQEQLRSTEPNERVFAQMSSELATQGFDKTTSQCKSKIKWLETSYKIMKGQSDSKMQECEWFTIMDKVLSHKPEAETKQAAEDTDTKHDISDPVEGLGSRWSLSSLRLLVPTLRLMCAFAWQVVQCCNVAHYGKVEELVRMAMELAPELLNPREKVQVLLRLRARFVLELCRSESTATPLNIQPHMKAIQNLEIGTRCGPEEMEELEKSKSNFAEVVQTLLEEPEERTVFFQNVFPIHYGHQYEATLNSLVWKFISRLDHLLPVPDIKQTAEWLSTAPSLMEECGQLVLDPDQLKAVIQLHQRSENTNKSRSDMQNMFLPRLSISHKANQKQLTQEQIRSNSLKCMGCSPQQEMSAGDEDEGPLDCSEEEEEPIEEDNADHKPPAENCGNREESDDPAAVNHSTRALCTEESPMRLQTCSLCPSSDSQTSGNMVQEPGQPHCKEPRTDSVPPQANRHKSIPETKSTTNTEDLPALKSRTKTRTPPFQCDICEKKYSSKWSLKVHRLVHTGETPHLCSYCGRGFRSSSSLGMHVRIHTGDRRYKCHICGKTSIQHLARHMRMHNGEKNYPCTECGKAFLSSGELRLHMRLHTGERPYTCKHCGRGFTAKCRLTVHMRQHTGESPYRCSLCPKSFSTLKTQKRHVKIHNNKKSFQCLKCGKIFRQEGTFKMHVQTHK